MKRFLGIGVATVIVSGCTTTLGTRHVGVQQEPLPGALYALPMAAFDVDAQVAVTKCTMVATNTVELDYELVDGAIHSLFVPDPEETYSVDYTMLNSALKTTKVSISMHPNGMIKEVNADVEDRTAQVLAAAGKTTLTLYKAIVPGLAMLSESKLGTSCGAFIDDKIKERSELLGKKIPEAQLADDELAQDKAAASDIATKLDAANAKLAEATKAKDNTAIKAQTAIVEKLKAEQTAAQAKLKDKTPQLPTLKTRLAILNKLLTVPLHLQTWTPRAAAGPVCKDIESSQQEYFQKFPKPQESKLKASSLKNFEIQICVEPVGGFTGAAATTTDVPSYGGIVYRMPTSGKVWIQNKQEKIYATNLASLPQFGAKGLVWLQNKAFDKNNVKVAFNEDGSLSELNFGAAARAELAATAISDSSQTVLDLMKLRAQAAQAKADAVGEEQKKAQQKQLDAIDAQISLIQKRKELESAQHPTKDSYDIQKDQLQKQIDVETLRQQLEDLKKKAATQ